MASWPLLIASNILSFRLCIEGYKEPPEETNRIKDFNAKNPPKKNVENSQNLTFVPKFEEKTSTQDIKQSNKEGKKKDEVKDYINNSFDFKLYTYLTNFISYMILAVNYLKYLLNSIVTQFYHFKYVF